MVLRPLARIGGARRRDDLGFHKRRRRRRRRRRHLADHRILDRGVRELALEQLRLTRRVRRERPRGVLLQVHTEILQRLDGLRGELVLGTDVREQRGQRRGRVGLLIELDRAGVIQRLAPRDRQLHEVLNLLLLLRRRARGRLRQGLTDDQRGREHRCDDARSPQHE